MVVWMQSLQIPEGVRRIQAASTIDVNAVMTGRNDAVGTRVAHGAGPQPSCPSELIVTDPMPRPVNPPVVCTRSDQASFPAGGSGGCGTSGTP